MKIEKKYAIKNEKIENIINFLESLENEQDKKMPSNKRKLYNLTITLLEEE